MLFALLLPAGALNLRWMVLGVGGSRAIALGLVLSRLLVLVAVVFLVVDESDLTRVPVIEAAGTLVMRAGRSLARRRRTAEAATARRHPGVA